MTWGTHFRHFSMIQQMHIRNIFFSHPHFDRRIFITQFIIYNFIDNRIIADLTASYLCSPQSFVVAKRRRLTMAEHDDIDIVRKRGTNVCRCFWSLLWPALMTSQICYSNRGKSRGISRKNNTDDENVSLAKMSHPLYLPQ